MNDDADLAVLLRDAVSDVVAEGGPDDVRARAGRPRGRGWLPVAIAAAVAMVLALAGTAWLSSGGHDAARPGHHAASGPPGGGRSVQVPVFYLGATSAGPRLFLEHHVVTATADSTLQVAVDQALSAAPQDPDYRNPMRDFGVRATTGRTRDAIVVDLSRMPLLPHGYDRRTAPMVVQALVHTAQTAAVSDLPVQLLVGGERVDSVLGVDTRRPLEPMDDDSVVSPVSIDSPAQGETVGRTFTVRGQAEARHGQVEWELTGAPSGPTPGVPVRQGVVSAEQCCTLSPYSFVVSAPPGRYVLRTRVDGDSRGSYAGVAQDTKDITIR